MKKNIYITKTKLATLLSTVFALLIFIIPTIATAKWLTGMFKSQESRKATPVPALQLRAVDATDLPLAPFKKPLVTITFDDGWESVYTNALPILQKNGFCTTQYVIAGTLDNQLYMSKAQISAMQKSCTDIGSHTLTHKDLTTLTDEQLEKELADSQQILTKDFVKTVDFTSPLGSYNTHTLQMIKKYYRSHKNAEGDPAANDLQSINVGETFDPYNIQSYSVRQTTTIQDIQKLIDDAVKYNGWLVLTYHQIDDSGTLYSVSPDALQEQLRTIAASPLRSATVKQVLDQIGQGR